MTKYEYSAYGDPDGGHLTLVTDADNKFTRYTYDKFGNLAIVNGPNATGLAGSSPQRTWVYDHRNFLQSDTQPEKGQTTYGYDSAGNVTGITDLAGTITLTYDVNNRLLTRDAPATGDDLEVRYTPTGQVSVTASPTVAAATTKTTYGYESTTDRVSWRADLVNGHTFGSAYSYLLNDAVNQITYPSTRLVTHTYDPQGRLKEVKNNGVIFADNFAFGDHGRLIGYRTSTVNHTIAYDARQRLERITAGSQPNGLDLKYHHDIANQIWKIEDTRNAATTSQTFDYDPVGRLWAADGPWGNLRWSYDAAGNRLSETRGSITNYVLNAATQRLDSTNGGVAETFTYDNIGRLESDGRGTYTYNARGLLATATKTGSGLSASYAYDAAGLRSVRTVNNQTAYTVRGVGGSVLSEFVSPCGGAPAWARDVIYAGGRLLGAVRAALTAPTVTMNAATLNASESGSVDVGVNADDGRRGHKLSRDCFLRDRGRHGHGGNQRRRLHRDGRHADVSDGDDVGQLPPHRRGDLVGCGERAARDVHGCCRARPGLRSTARRARRSRFSTTTLRPRWRSNSRSPAAPDTGYRLRLGHRRGHARAERA